MLHKHVRSLAPGTPHSVIAHGVRRIKRGKTPTLQFNGILNPKDAFEKALQEAELMGLEFGFGLAAHLERAQKTTEAFYAPVEMKTLATGVVGIRGPQNQIHVYFDPELWALKESELEERAFPPALKGSGLGVLQGTLSASPVKSFAGGRKFAKQALRPKFETPLEWYPTEDVNVIALR